eukprot:5430544-Alexandrium_andersonii.AAC.1
MVPFGRPYIAAAERLMPFGGPSWLMMPRWRAAIWANRVLYIPRVVETPPYVAAAARPPRKSVPCSALTACEIARSRLPNVRRRPARQHQ